MRKVQQLVADKGSQLRKYWRNPIVRTAVGFVATVVLALIVVRVLAGTDGDNAVSKNAALIGALVALGGVFTTQLVNSALDDRRAQRSRRLEIQRAHEAALQKYLEQVGMLLIQHPKPYNFGKVARAQTLAVLKGLRKDKDRKRVLMIFLSESKLLDKYRNYDFNLRLADLSDADLGELLDEVLSCKNLSETVLVRANLSRTSLRNSDLTRADLTRACLKGANLEGANLEDADLEDANLCGAIHVTQEQLDSCKTLQGATMPNGQKYEDWLNDREGGKEDGENSGP